MKFPERTHPTMAGRAAKELQEYMNQLERVVESAKTPREKISLARRKMERLGGHVKKHPVPLKHMMKRIEKKKASAAAERERLRSMGVCKKKRR